MKKTPQQWDKVVVSVGWWWKRHEVELSLHSLGILHHNIGQLRPQASEQNWALALIIFQIKHWC